MRTLPATSMTSTRTHTMTTRISMSIALLSTLYSFCLKIYPYCTNLRYVYDFGLRIEGDLCDELGVTLEDLGGEVGGGRHRQLFSVSDGGDSIQQYKGALMSLHVPGLHKYGRVSLSGLIYCMARENGLICSFRKNLCTRMLQM